ncbi:MAG: DUF883 family protein [Planctomycetes bacterium]|nr:DUF883 family protein [Planctomycetota bacterium]
MSASNTITKPSTDSSDLGEQVRVIGNDVKELARITKDALTERAQLAKEAGVAVVERGKDKISHAREQLEDATREQPLKSVLVAAGVGAVIGLIFARR